MSHHRHPSGDRAFTLSFVGLLSVLTLASCGAPKIPAESEAIAPTAQLDSAGGEAAPEAAGEAPADEATTEVPESAPQLAKTADLSLTVDAIDAAVDGISSILQKQDGDILFLEEEEAVLGKRQQASLEMRVPQQKLEATLDMLADLGQVQSRTIAAEDVSTQLVDLDARLTNLRKSEEMVLKIMERSGSVADVLQAAREVSQIRESIERIDAQLKALQNRVAYSTIRLQLEAPAAADTTAQPRVGRQLQETWVYATGAMRSLTLGLLSLGIWLIAFSPYLLAIGGAVFAYQKLKRKPTAPKENTEG